MSVFPTPQAVPPWAAWCGDERVVATPLAGSGFSGASVFLVERPDGGKWVLKNFGPHVLPARALWIHGLMAHLRAGGLDTVPRPAELPGQHAALPATPQEAVGGTLLLVRVARDQSPARDHLPARDQSTAGDELWEFVEFLPGGPRSAPSPAEAARALAALGQLHAVAATLPDSEVAVEASPGVIRRGLQAARMLAAPWRTLAGRAGPESSSRDLMARLRLAVEIFETHRGRESLASVAAVRPLALSVQPVLRDLWSDHVLFHDDGRLSGFIDFHAAARDTPWTDVARLLGSWDASPDASAAAAPVSDRWAAAVDAYAPGRPPTRRDRRLIDWLHASAVICGLDNWFRWLIVERRQFADHERVFARVDRLLAALPRALATVRDVRPDRD